MKNNIFGNKKGLKKGFLVLMMYQDSRYFYIGTRSLLTTLQSRRTEEKSKCTKSFVAVRSDDFIYLILTVLVTLQLILHIGEYQPLLQVATRSYLLPLSLSIFEHV